MLETKANLLVVDQANDEPVSTMPENRASVLVVDDHLDNLRTLSAILKSEGYKVRKAMSGEMALGTIRSQHPDLILLDIRMPEMDGYEVCSVLKASAETREIPIIFLSALDDVVDKVKAFNTGGVDYITKPFQAEEVLVRIRHQLTLQQQQQQLIQQNRKLQLESQQRLLLVNVIKHIRQSLQLEQVLEVAVAEVRQLLGIDRVVICRIQPNGNGEIIAESVNSVALSLREKIIDYAGFKEYWQQFSNQHKTSVIFDVKDSNLPVAYAQFLMRLPIRASLAAPICVSQKTWGLLVAHQCNSVRRWEEWEIDFFQQLSEQLAIAIQQSQLFKQVQQLNTNLEQQVHVRTAELQQALGFETTLKRITDKVRDSLDETQILQTALEELAKAMEACCCDATLYDSNKIAAITHYEYSKSSQCVTQESTRKFADIPEIYQQFQQGIDFAFCLLMGSELKSYSAILSCPIIDDQSVLGELWILKPASSSFGKQEINLVKQVANHCAIALRQAGLYRAAQAQLRELQRLNQLKDDFLSTISHELRTPLANIQMVVRLLQVGAGTNSSGSQTQEAKVAQYLKILQDECDRELHLVNDLLELQYLEAGIQPFQPTTINLNDWIIHLLETFHSRTQNQQQTLLIQLDPNLPAITTDQFSLTRILTELLNNACKYTPKQETITVAARVENQTLYIKVSNSGVEISTEEISRIFDKFYRIPSHDPWKYGGTGLGLALVKRLAEHLAGLIEVASASGQTQFTLQLPLQPNRNEQ